MLIQETIVPDSWYEAGGEGTITSYEGKKLIIYQTPEIHNEIAKLLEEMRKALGHQVSIEARFLVVSENYLEDVGLDVDAQIRLGSRWGVMEITQGSSEGVTPSETKVPGTLAGTISGLGITGLGYGSAMDDLMVSFMIRALQAHKDSRTLTAPKVTVLSGESATFSVQTDTVIALPPEVSSTIYPTAVGETPTTESIIPTFETIQSGTTLNITPIISPDKKHVLLNITTYLNDFLGMKTYNLETPMPDGTIAKYSQELPETEWSQVQTRVSVPDSATLLLGGQKLTAEIEMEAGVPVLSKIPFLGRIFTNRSKVKDQRILLILVKPTIILQEEADAKALAALESNF
jgi:general secretion pathway protein D